MRSYGVARAPVCAAGGSNEALGRLVAPRLGRPRCARPLAPSADASARGGKRSTVEPIDRGMSTSETERTGRPLTPPIPRGRTRPNPRGRLLRVREVAARLGIGKSTTYALIARGDLPAIQLRGRGSTVLVDENELLPAAARRLRLGVLVVVAARLFDRAWGGRDIPRVAGRKEERVSVPIREGLSSCGRLSSRTNPRSLPWRSAGSAPPRSTVYGWKEAAGRRAAPSQLGK